MYVYTEGHCYPTGHYCCRQHVYSFHDHTEQRWVIANAYINTRHHKDDVYQKSFSYVYVNILY